MERVQIVLDCFAQMGATPEELEQDRVRLLTDDAYYTIWCGHLGWIDPPPPPSTC